MDDPGRRFTFGFSAEDTRMSLWYCDRTQFIVSDSFDFVTVSLSRYIRITGLHRLPGVCKPLPVLHRLRVRRALRTWLRPNCHSCPLTGGNTAV